MKKRLTTLIKIVFVIAACLLLWHLIDPQEMIRLFRHMSVFFFCATVLVCVLDKVLVGFKWNYLLKVFGIHVPVSAPIVANLRAKVFQLFTPTTIGEDAYKAFYIKQCGAPLSPTVSSIVVERIIGALSSLAIISLLLYFPLKQFDISHTLLIFLGGLLGFAGLTLFVAVLIHFSGHLLHGKWLRWLPNKINKKIEESAAIFLRMKQERRNIWYFYFLSVFEKIAYGSALYFSARAIGLAEIDYIYIISATPLLALLERLPISISSIGLREGLIVVMLQPYFFDSTTPVAVALVFRLAEIVMTLFCLFLWIGKHDGRTYKQQIRIVDAEIMRLRTRPVGIDGA